MKRIQKRKLWFEVFKKILKIRYKKVEFVYKGKKPNGNSIILSNHEGTDAPLSLEIYADFPVRFWGTSEMNNGLIKMYKYQTKVYYAEKKHWNIHLARIFCLLASPLTNLFYKGLNLISVYKDYRFKSTIAESMAVLENEKTNIVIFPEISDEGYLEELKGFYAGFVVLCERLYKYNIDVDIFPSYFNKKKKKYYFGKPIKFSKVKEMFSNRQEICDYFTNECNKLNKENN